jgi:nucleotide-binding universal stress UspA family protein
MAETNTQMATFGDYELRGVAVRRLVQVGDPVEQIATFVHTEGVKLVAMPTHGLGALRRILIGSVTAKVLHDVSCPVLTGVHMEQPPHHLPLTFSNIACAVDLDSQSQETLTWAAHFANDFHAQLNIVHAIPALEPGFEIPFGGDWKSDLANLAREDLEKLVVATASDVSGIYVQAGEPRKTVCSFAKSSGADLLIIGRGSHEEIPANLPTEAYAIIRESPCPVISV